MLACIGELGPTTAPAGDGPGTSPGRAGAAVPGPVVAAAEAITPNASPARESASPRRLRRGRLADTSGAVGRTRSLPARPASRSVPTGRRPAAGRAATAA